MCPLVCRVMGDSTPITDDRVQIYCSSAVREQVKAQKRGGETYDDVLRKMVSQYDPEGRLEQEPEDSA